MNKYDGSEKNIGVGFIIIDFNGFVQRFLCFTYNSSDIIFCFKICCKVFS